MSGLQSLPVGDIVAETYRFLWANRRDMLRLAAMPILTLSILVIAITFGLGGEPVEDGEKSVAFTVGQVLLVIASTVFYVMFAVAWHRRCLRPEEQLTIWTALRWDQRKTRFLLRSIAVGLIVAAMALAILLMASIVAGVVGGGATMIIGVGGKSLPRGLVMIVTLATIIPALLLNARLALWLPAAAVDDPMTLPEAWQTGDGRSWRLFSILAMVSAPGIMLFMIAVPILAHAGAAMGVGDTLTFALIKGLVATFIDYVVIAAGVSGLSFTYKRLRPPSGPGMPFFINNS